MLYCAQAIKGGVLRENLLRDLARRAATDPDFLGRLRENVEETLAGYGYDLTREELRLVKDLRRRTALISDEDLAHLLSGGLGGRSANPPARPAAPGRGSPGPARPARPADVRRSETGRRSERS